MVVCHLFSELVDKQSITALFTIPDKQREHGREELVWAILKPRTVLTVNDSPPPREFVWLLLYNEILRGCTFSLVPTDLVGISGRFFVSQNYMNI